ncbi:TlpA family protein disulfide reductase [Gordonia hydrophobica]|uniref:Thioredoxin family protein n=1 Tax=Gordonia hydrophobica TaxID=40516 RepID=A0ABZ2TXA9_9ACTN|nr:thioredoxin family protein [Gordonia hydrophobica]MBM7366287.1 thiol-disulfide isomerase/thioredoxin [Gordonia hydrophobica]
MKSEVNTTVPDTDGVGDQPQSLAKESLDLIGQLGSRATILQISSGFCAPCRATRLLLKRVVDAEPGVHYAEIDLAFHPEQAERLQIVDIPTVFFLSPQGTILSRLVGVPRLAAARALLHKVAPST